MCLCLACRGSLGPARRCTVRSLAMAPREEDLVCVYVADAVHNVPASAACNGCVEAAHGRCLDVCEGAGTSPPSARARYTAAQLRSALLLMGCKPRVAHKVRCRASCLF